MTAPVAGNDVGVAHVVLWVSSSIVFVQVVEHEHSSPLIVLLAVELGDLLTAEVAGDLSLLLPLLET